MNWPLSIFSFPADLLRFLQDRDLIFPPPRATPYHQLAFVAAQVRNHGAQSIAIESEYIDRDFMEDYSIFYSRSLVDYPNFCTRLHFFKTSVEETRAKIEEIGGGPAIVATAKEVDMDVIGHVPMALSVDEIVDAGQIMIAHSEELAKHTGDDSSAEKIDALAGQLTRNGVWMIPTLITTQSILELFDDPDKLLGRPEAAYYRHPLQAGVWTFVVKNLYGPIPPQGRQSLRDAYGQFQRPLTKAIQKKGGKLLAGSDSILPGLVPGFALQRELHELVDAGLTPFEALRTSTTAPFEYLRADRIACRLRSCPRGRPTSSDQHARDSDPRGCESARGHHGCVQLDREGRDSNDDAEHRGAGKTRVAVRPPLGRPSRANQSFAPTRIIIRCRDRDGKEGRHHLHETVVQRAVSDAAKAAGICKRVTCHTFRRSLPPICSSADMTLGPCRNSWVIATSRPR